MTAIPRVALGELVTITGGGTPARSNPAYFDGDIPWVTPKDMKAPELCDSLVRITARGLRESATKLVPPGSVLIVVRSGVLKHSLPIAINRVPVALNQDMKALSTGPRLQPEYLAHYLRARTPEILRWARAATHGAADNFPVERLRDMELPLPSLAEQRRVAAILDRAEGLRAKRRQALALLDALVQSIFTDMFGDLDENSRGWPRTCLDDLLLLPLRNGVSPSRGGTLRLPVLTLSAITGARFADTAAKEGPFSVAPPPSQRVDARDMLICRGNGNLSLVGRAHFPSASLPRVVFPDTMIAARPDPAHIVPSYLEHVWNSRCVRNQIAAAARTTNGTHKINQQGVGRVQFPVPPVELQAAFAARRQAVEGIRAAAVHAIDATDRLFSSLQQRAFRGEL